MTHLSPDELVDVAEGRIDPARATHAASCDRCRAQVESMREALRLVESDRAPEPSPLFWPLLAARIGEAVRGERRPGAFAWTWAWRLVPIGALAVLVTAVGIGISTRSGRPGGRPVTTAAARDAAPRQAAEPAAAGEPADDPSWLLVSDLSADISVEDTEASGALTRPGGVDPALWQLSDAERSELTRILREELTRGETAVPRGSGA
jgi:hypothetical protein